MREVSDFFRYIFNNDWPEYVVCTACDSTLPQGMKISAREIFGEKGSVPLERMDAFKELPDCPHCAQPMELFHDPQRTFELIKKRLSSDGYLSLLRDDNSGQVEGISYGYGCLLGEQFESEWANTYNYMQKRDPRYNRRFDDFIACIDNVFPKADFSDDTEVFCWNSVAISRRARKAGRLRELIGAFLDAIPPEKFRQYIIGEVIIGSRYHRILEKGGLHVIPGFLDDPETLIGGIFQGSADAFRLPPDDFAKISKSS